MEERGLWSIKRVRLSYDQPKSANCLSLITYTVFIKGQKCEFCKETKEHSGQCIKQKFCNICDNQKSITYNIRKSHYTKTVLKCEKITLKCTTKNKFFNLLFKY